MSEELLVRFLLIVLALFAVACAGASCLIHERASRATKWSLESDLPRFCDPGAFLEHLTRACVASVHAVRSEVLLISVGRHV